MTQTKMKAQICYDGAGFGCFVREPDGSDNPVGEGTHEECVEYCEAAGYEWENSVTVQHELGIGPNEEL